jgi:hypothetical protein
MFGCHLRFLWCLKGLSDPSGKKLRMALFWSRPLAYLQAVRRRDDRIMSHMREARSIGLVMKGMYWKVCHNQRQRAK